MSEEAKRPNTAAKIALAAIVAAQAALLAAALTTERASGAGQPESWDERVHIVASAIDEDGTADDTVCTGYLAPAASVRTSNRCFADPADLGDAVVVVDPSAEEAADRLVAATEGRVEGDFLMIDLVID